MDSLASLTGQPQVLRVGGSTYFCYPLTVNDFGKLQSWIDEQFPDPFDVARKQMDTGNWNTAQQQFILKTASELAARGKPKIGSPEADSLLQSPDGIKRVLHLSISKGDPAFTWDRAEELYDQMTLGDMSSLYNGSNADMVMHDPKAGNPPSTSNGKKTSRGRRRKANSHGGSSSTKP